jgi:hypothetical protein
VLPGLPGVAELQLMFAQYNFLYFDGEIPTYQIAYNARFSNLAGRITYKPPMIELSPKHLAGKPDELRETLLHEMIHAWLHAKGMPPGHTPTFKKKMRELGLRSIYHDLGKAAPLACATIGGSWQTPPSFSPFLAATRAMDRCTFRFSC